MTATAIAIATAASGRHNESTTSEPRRVQSERA